MPATIPERVTLEVSDGSKMGAYVVRPDGAGPFPLLLVFHEVFGLNAHIRSVADRFGREGYIAVAPDLFHRTAPGFECRYDDANAMTEEGLRADLDALQSLFVGDPRADRSRCGAVGFCMGGRAAFLANAWVPMRAAVCFYPAGLAQRHLDRAADQRGPVLFFWAGRDLHVTREDREAVAEAMERHGKPHVRVEFSTAEHGFFCDARPSYRIEAARPAWYMSLAFLDAHVRG